MDTVGLHELWVQRNARQEKVDEGHVETLCELRIDVGEGLRIGLAVIRWNSNTHQQDARAMCAAHFDHVRQVVAQRIYRQSTQTVVAAELDHDEGRRMSLKQLRQTGQAAGGRVAGDTGIHHFGTVTLRLQATCEHRNPRLLRGQPVAAAQRIAQDDDGLPGAHGGGGDEHRQRDEDRETSVHDRELLLQAEGLTKKVSSPEGELTILDHVDLGVAAGESAAIVGPSGAGKSTLLALLAGLDEPTSGKVWLRGAELTALDEDGRASLRNREVGFVFQSFHLLPSLTAVENVMLPLELSGAPEAAARARQALVDVGLRERLRHYPRQLSGGEKQRVAIARAFVSDPSLLFADEPTGNLDNKTGERILALLFELNAKAGTTLVLVTHDLDAAGRCNRVIELAGGQVVSP
jgi:putative ABC transport system ATP-binding protein